MLRCKVFCLLLCFQNESNINEYVLCTVRRRCSDGQFIICARTDAAGVCGPSVDVNDFKHSFPLLRVCKAWRGLRSCGRKSQRLNRLKVSAAKAGAYVKAGADMIFPEGLQSEAGVQEYYCSHNDKSVKKEIHIS